MVNVEAFSCGNNGKHNKQTMETNKEQNKRNEEIEALYAKLKLDENYTEPTHKIEPAKKYIDEKDFCIEADEDGNVKRIFLCEE